MSARLHLSTDIIHGWPLAGVLPRGVGFAPAISRFPDHPDLQRGDLASVWPAAPDDAWAQRLLRDVPADFAGLVMLDNEGPNAEALWAPLGSLVDPARRKASTAAMGRQLDACKRARPRAKLGFYGIPTGGWYAPRMYPQTRRLGDELGEIYRHCSVIMPSLYCPERTPGHEGYAEFIMDMASTIADDYGKPLAAVVGTRCYSHGDDEAVLLDERVLGPWMKVVMKHHPDHLVYWHSEPWFVRLLRVKHLGRPLTDGERAACLEEGARNVAWGLRFFQEFAS